jgi:hypothetical protein
MQNAISLSAVVEALEIASDDMSSYVNKKTGEVVMLGHEEMGFAEEDADGDMPDWQRELVAKAKEVLRSADWLALPDKFEIHEWEIMDRFGQSLAGAAERREIGDAIRGNGAFRMFKSTIRRLGMEDAWFAFKQRTLEEMARDWLNQHGLPIEEAPPDKRVK